MSSSVPILTAEGASVSRVSSHLRRPELLFWTFLSHSFRPQHQHLAITISSHTETDRCSLASHLERTLPLTPHSPATSSPLLCSAPQRNPSKEFNYSHFQFSTPTLSLTQLPLLSTVLLHNFSKSPTASQTSFSLRRCNPSASWQHSLPPPACFVEFSCSLAVPPALLHFTGWKPVPLSMLATIFHWAAEPASNLLCSLLCYCSSQSSFR